MDTILYVHCSEIFTTHIRSQGMAFSMFGPLLSTVVFLEAGSCHDLWRHFLEVSLTRSNLLIAELLDDTEMNEGIFA